MCSQSPGSQHNCHKMTIMAVIHKAVIHKDFEESLYVSGAPYRLL